MPTWRTFLRDDLKRSCHRSYLIWALGDLATRLCLLTLSLGLNGFIAPRTKPKIGRQHG